MSDRAPAYTPADPQEVRPIPVAEINTAWDVPGIRASVDRALATLQEGETVAIVAHADLDGGRLVVMGRPFERWTFMGTLQKRWRGPLSAEASVVFAF